MRATQILRVGEEQATGQGDVIARTYTTPWQTDPKVVRTMWTNERAHFAIASEENVIW